VDIIVEAGLGVWAPSIHEKSWEIIGEISAETLLETEIMY